MYMCIFCGLVNFVGKVARKFHIRQKTSYLLLVLKTGFEASMV